MSRTLYEVENFIEKFRDSMKSELKDNEDKHIEVILAAGIVCCQLILDYSNGEDPKAPEVTLN